MVGLKKHLNRHKSPVLKDFPEDGFGDKSSYFASVRLKISAWLLSVQRTCWVQLLQREKGGEKVAWWLSKHLARVLCFYYTLLMLRGLKKLVLFGSSLWVEWVATAAEWSSVSPCPKMPNYGDVMKRSLPNGTEVMASTDSNYWVFFSVMDVCLYLM